MGCQNTSSMCEDNKNKDDIYNSINNREELLIAASFLNKKNGVSNTWTSENDKYECLSGLILNLLINNQIKDKGNICYSFNNDVDILKILRMFSSLTDLIMKILELRINHNCSKFFLLNFDKVLFDKETNIAVLHEEQIFKNYCFNKLIVSNKNSSKYTLNNNSRYNSNSDSNEASIMYYLYDKKIEKLFHKLDLVKDFTKEKFEEFYTKVLINFITKILKSLLILEDEFKYFKMFKLEFLSKINKNKKSLKKLKIQISEFLNENANLENFIWYCEGNYSIKSLNLGENKYE